MSRWHKLAISSLCLALFFLAVSFSYAVQEFRASAYGGGHQIWFEAEAFDERDPDSENVNDVGFKSVKAETNIDLPQDAFGDAMVNVLGNDDIWLLYNFDISKAGGKSGTWYIWTRTINPNNASEFLWVLGDDGEEIPDAKPEFVKDDDRAFEEPTEPPWAWLSRQSEGETKELRDGENTMMIWFREGDIAALRDVFVWVDTLTYTPTDEDYINATEKSTAVEPGDKLPITWAELKKH